MKTEWAKERYAQHLPGGLTFHQHETLEQCMASEWGVTVEDVKEGEYGVVVGDSEEQWSWETYRDVILANAPVYGFARTDRDPREVHFWFGPDATPEQRVALIAHEIGHLIGTPLEDEGAEEDRAETFAAVALMAMTESKRGAA